MNVVAVVLWVLVSAVLATTQPLLSYTTSLACFGLLHVVSELRYVDARFGRRLPRSLWAGVGVPLLGIVVLRALTIGGVVAGASVIRGELALVAVAITVGAVTAIRHRVAVAGIGAVAAIAVLGITVGVVVAPLETLLVLALTHNLTPMGFIIERAAPGHRAATTTAAAAAFVGVPLFIATGWPGHALSAFADVTAVFFGAGDLSRHVGVYLWPAWQNTSHTLDLFSAAVCAQLLHYGAVIIWLPRALTPAERPSLPWPSWPVLVGGLVIGAGGLAIHFASDFAGARALYGLPAAVHAWLELPLLLVAFSQWPASSSSSSS